MAGLGVSLARDAAPAAGDGRVSWARLARIVALYAPDALFFGFLLTALPYQLRLEGGGAALSAVVMWLVLPLGFAFLWAPFVDGLRFPGLGRRSGWAGACQLAAALTFAAAALAFVIAPDLAGPKAALLPSLLAAFLLATRNLALNAWMRESLPDSAVATAIGVRCAGAAVGNWIGAGVLAGAFDSLGWSGVFWALAAVTLASSLAIWRLPGQADEATAGSVPRLAKTIAAMRRRPGVSRGAWSIAAISAVMAPPSSFGPLILADKGFSAEQLGYAAGYAGSAAAAVGALAGGKFAEVFGLRTMLVASAFAQSALCLGWAGFAFSSSTSFLAGLCLTASQFGLYALMASLWMAGVMRLAARENAATELALLNALLLVAGTLAPTLAGAAADLSGSLGAAFIALALACAATSALAGRAQA